jgi:hypothetical protein
MQFFGDSYDVVKRLLIRTVAPHAKWTAFPMFTHEVEAADISAFEAFLGVSVASRHAMTLSTDRAGHLLALAGHRHIFLDPDTGIKLKPSNGADAVKYVFGPELVALCEQRHDRVVLVFDQSVPRGAERKAIAGKLGYFREKGICGFAYLSHARFFVLSCSEPVCEAALKRLLATHLPQTRLVGANDAYR